MVVVRLSNRQLHAGADLVDHANTFLDADRRQRGERSAVTHRVMLRLDLVLVSHGQLWDTAGVADRPAQALTTVFDERILTVRVVEQLMLAVHVLAQLGTEHGVVDGRRTVVAQLAGVRMHDLNQVIVAHRAGDVECRGNEIRIVVPALATLGDRGLLAELAIPAGILLHRLQLDLSKVLAAKDHAGALQIDGLGWERDLVKRLERGDRWQILLDVLFLVLAGAGLAQFLHELFRIADREIGQEGRDDIRGLLLGFGIRD